MTPNLEDLGIRLRTAGGSDPATVRLRTPALIADGRRLALNGHPLVIGSGPGCDIHVPGAAARHAEIGPDGNGGHTVQDLSGEPGTGLNGQTLRGAGRLLQAGDAITVRDSVVHFLTGQEARLPEIARPAAGVARTTFRIGSGPDNDLVLDHPMVSEHHAEVVVTGGGPAIRDLHSTAGTLVGGVRVGSRALVPGMEVGIGPYRLVFDGRALVPRERLGVRLEARGLTVDVGGKRILQPVHLAIEPGQLVAIVGASGAGKTTLLRALAGHRRATYGASTLNGEDVSRVSAEMGFVPQDDIVHGRLTVLEALRLGARLRLPDGSSRERIEQVVVSVLAELDLTGHAHTRVDRLSGGQRKRVNVGIELLSAPSFLFLDEPTTGLDPFLERRTMALLRRLATGSRGIVLVTHTTQNLHLCDQLVVMGSGGVVLFAGPVEEARRFFGIQQLDDIYERIEADSPESWQARFERRPHRRAQVGALAAPPVRALAPASPPRHSAIRHVGVLMRRYALLLSRDHRNLAIIVGQVPLLALGVALVFDRSVLTDVDQADDAANLLFLLGTLAVWIGLIGAAREIIKERPIIERERRVGVRTGSYLASKLAILLPLTAVQVSVLVGVLFLVVPPGEPIAGVATLAAVLIVAAWVSVLLGLLVSALVTSEDQATSVIPLILLPQLLYAGALVPVEGLGPVMKSLSALIAARWAFEGAGSAVDLDLRIAADPQFSEVNRFGGEFASIAPLSAVAILFALLAIHLVALIAMMSRPPRREGRS